MPSLLSILLSLSGSPACPSPLSMPADSATMECLLPEGDTLYLFRIQETEINYQIIRQDWGDVTGGRVVDEESRGLVLSPAYTESRDQWEEDAK